ncbi:MAG: hypothetical protein ACOVSW_12770 [Candidatus Kapaibacteriota bacterium]
MATPQMVQSDYGLTEYSNVLQTSSFYNGKDWDGKYPQIIPSARYFQTQQAIEMKVGDELDLCVDEWLDTLQKYFDNLQAMIRNKDLQNSEGIIKLTQLDNILLTTSQSLQQAKYFLTKMLPHLRLDFMPAVAIDNEGEIDFEWYGRHGARASVTIGANGVLYFVSLFHGNRIKSRLTWLDKIPPIILTELDKIYKDKQA